jgi:hypothetical protein
MKISIKNLRLKNLENWFSQDQHAVNPQRRWRSKNSLSNTTRRKNYYSCLAFQHFFLAYVFVFSVYEKLTNGMVGKAHKIIHSYKLIE